MIFELNRATQIFAAYVNHEFAGVLLAEIKGEEKKHQNILEKTYIKFVDVIQKSFLKEGASIYEDTKKKQLAHYLNSHTPDGEILFLAADPDCKVKGIGTALLFTLQEREKGKTLYLYTDNACTYQFYEHRGFEKIDETDIVLEMPKGSVPLKCFLYSKTME